MFERVQQSDAHRVVVALLDTVIEVAPPKRFEHGLQLARIVQSGHYKPQRLHQLHALLLDVVLEKLAQRWVKREEPLVKHQGGDGRPGFNLREAFADQLFLGWMHEGLESSLLISSTDSI